MNRSTARRAMRLMVETALAFGSFFVAPRVLAQPVPSAVPDASPAATPSGTFGQGYTLRAKDGSSALTIRLRTQFQGFAETEPHDAEKGLSGGTDVGFLIRRMRVALQGYAIDEAIRYYVQLGFSPRDQEPDQLVPIRDAQLIWAGARDLNVRVGQMKVPFNRERLQSSSSLGMVDRSLSNAELNLDRDVGILLQSMDLFGLGGLLRYSLGVFGGDGRNRTTPGTGLLYAGRLEVAPFGGFDEFSGVDFGRSRKLRIALGVATAFSDRTPRLRGTTGTTFQAGTVDYRHGAVDVILKVRGLSVQSELLFRKAGQPSLSQADEAGRVVTEYARSAWGYMVQAGLMLSDRWEPSLRYSEVRPLDQTNPALVRDREVGGGVGYYRQKHDLKVQLDYFRLLTDVGGDSHAVLGRDRVRLQAQVFF